MVTGGQIELFRPTTDEARLATLKAFLRDRGWVTAATLHLILKLNDRDCRALAEVSNGQIISGQRGYKLTAQATPEEIAHASSWLISQGQKMIRRGLAIRRCAHRRIA